MHEIKELLNIYCISFHFSELIDFVTPENMNIN